MSTTDLFVELVVTGIGAAIWLVLAVLSLFGYEWVPLDQVLSLAALIPFLSVVYALGIVIDRLADAIFQRLWAGRLFRRFYGDEESYFEDRRLIYTYSKRLSDLLEYGRSRLRICRGWTLNGVLVLAAFNAFVWMRVPDRPLQVKLSLAGSLLIALFALGNWFAWRKLALNEYRKVQSQAAFLRARGMGAAGVGEGERD